MTYTPFPEPIADIGTPERAAQDVAMMKNWQHWPLPVLPMKRLDPETARLDTAIWDGTRLHIGADLYSRQARQTILAVPEVIVAQGWTTD